MICEAKVMLGAGPQLRLRRFVHKSGRGRKEERSTGGKVKGRTLPGHQLSSRPTLAYPRSIAVHHPCPLHHLVHLRHPIGGSLPRPLSIAATGEDPSSATAANPTSSTLALLCYPAAD